MNVLMNIHFRTFILAIVFLCQSTWAQSTMNQGMIFEGSLTDSSGNAIDLQSQQLYFYVSANDNLAEKCILFAESSMEFCDGTNWRGINGITYCDTGNSIVGTPGTPSAFCIDTAIGSSQSYEIASANCNSRNPSSGSKAKVCSTMQLDTTCESYTLVSPAISNFNNITNHWTSTAIPVGVAMNYPRNVFVAYNSADTATCHLQPTTGASPFNGRISDSANLNTMMNFRCCYE